MVAKIEGYYYGEDGELLKSFVTTSAEPGNKTPAVLQGILADYNLYCNASDTRASIVISAASDDVQRGGLFGLNGRFGPKTEGSIGPNAKGHLTLRGKRSEREEITVSHIQTDRTKRDL